MQRGHNADSSSHNPHSEFADTEDRAGFRGETSWIRRPLQPNREGVDRTEGTVEGQHQPGGTEGGEPECFPAHRGDVPVVDQLVASASTTPIYEQPNPPAEDPQQKPIQAPSPLHRLFPEILDQGKLAIILKQVTLTTLKTQSLPPRSRPVTLKRLSSVRASSICRSPLFTIVLFQLRRRQLRRRKENWTVTTDGSSSS